MRFMMGKTENISYYSINKKNILNNIYKNLSKIVDQQINY